ncbi:aldehyde dehydrogenase [Paenibacillus montaniterrae]|uniref:Aldehyde dehydrogenase n=1 Tax=Paenibacillus montaniterrae TaxID=429341 RepID=A0A920CWQ9_9BACL|nr:aldehyde dehydrogenase family protein [Paenibacillus montaniterrae]GIP15515.1 aldehyde dehydrogenase [Paenibacillus montaniterrae]
MKQLLYIGGEWVEGHYETALFSPYSGKKLADVAGASLEQADLAVLSAVQAKSSMRKLSAHIRSGILERVSMMLAERRDEAAELIALEAAKPIKAAYIEVDRTVITFKLAAEEAKRISGETIPMDSVPGGEQRFAYTKKEPVGVVGAITPFNFPMNLVAHKLGPALAAGNSVVLKPAEQTPLSSYFIATLFHEAGLPPGALNVITGRGPELGEYIVSDERVSYITFTGSPAVGEQVRRNARLKRVTLELGSNSAVIIDGDVNVEQAAARCVTGAFSNQGQVCISLQRIYVMEEVFDKFVEAFIAQAKQLVLGDPLLMQTDVSVLIHPSAVERVLSWVHEAMQQGAELALGGYAKQRLLQPTVLLHVPEHAKVMQQEVFAPIVSINRVSTIEQAIALVNQSQFGLQAGIYTNRLETALDASDKLEAGGVLINDIPTFRLDHMPYGGWKHSGIGREGIKYAIEEMCETKLVIFNRS